MTSTLWALALGGALGILSPLVGQIGSAVADRIRYGRLPKPDDK